MTVFSKQVPDDWFFLANSADPDKMQSVIVHLGLHSLPKYQFRGFQSINSSTFFKNRQGTLYKSLYIYLEKLKSSNLILGHVKEAELHLNVIRNLHQFISLHAE